MKYVLYIVLLLRVFVLPPASTAIAQTTSTCPRAEADAYLDVNNVRARILNNGGLFYRGQPHVYEVPKDDSTSAIFAFNLWVGGLVESELRIAATRYGEWEFWPGPLDDLGNPPADCAPYDRLWEVTRDDLTAFNATGVASENLQAWPWQLGAPVIDGDGDPDHYNLDGGDRPALLGDQMFWWIMNDAGNLHKSTKSPPLGMEVHGSAFAFHKPGSFIDTITFYRYVLHYKGQKPLEDAYVGFYADNDLGNFDDDYVASDTMLHLGYTYNADEDDERGYGTPPPAVGYTILKGPRAQPDNRDNDRDGAIDEPGERHGMATFACFIKSGGTYGEPINAREYYHCLQGRWRNGDPIIVGGNGIEGLNDIPGATDTPTHFLFPGDPVAGEFWTMENIDGQGTARDPFDTRFSMSSGPFTMQPGETEEFLFAVVWARGTDRLDSVRELKKATAKLRDIADEILVPDVTSGLPALAEPEPSPVLGFAQNYPNPFSETTTIRYSLPKAMRVRLRVYDVLGRTITTLVDEQQEGGLYEVLFEAGDLPDGVYFYRIEMDHLRFTRPMMLRP